MSPTKCSMLMQCMLKTTESPNFPQSLSHKNKAKRHPMHKYCQARKPVADVERCPHMVKWNALLKMLCVTTLEKMAILAKCAEPVQNP